ncbi:basement membrane-specific heparan sulfate proteoglycan core protein-like, partial [Labeo rohita]|uniref:basement membrane-specific heparan sulfate proteoglycan core protein-like n=1 Tax=Labeo rohita TaxID=84645 RepID=UPI0021E2320D
VMSFIHSGLTEGTDAEMMTDDEDKTNSSTLPTSTLTVTPNSVFTGETVSLTCVIESHGDWRYEWYKGRTEVSKLYTVNGNTLTIKQSKTSDAGQYTCKGHIDARSVSSHSSFAVSLTVKALPTSILTVTPNSVFTGETVNMTCVIKSHGDWRYEWYKGRTEVSEVYTVNGNTLTIEQSKTSDAGQYTCKGHIDARSVSSHSSSAVSLTVKALPTSTLTVTPNSVFTGETVNLTCVIKSHGDWRYEWYKGRTEVSEVYTVNGNTLTIEQSKTSDAGQYTCKGHIDARSVSSQSSSAVSLTVKALPTSTLTVTPNSVFTGETVNLTCVIKSHGDWRYEWYKGRTEVSEVYTVNGNTLTIEQSKTSDAGQYTCKGHIDARSVSSQSSSAVSLTVKDLPTSTLTVNPNSVFTGETVNLKCVIESHYSNWRYEWYKGSTKVSEYYTVNRDTFTIRGVKKSDSGQYTCKGQRDGRPKSSQSSSAVSLTVMDLPTSTLTMNPNSVFTGETVSMKCVISSDHSNWRYEWYKGDAKVSERYTVNTLTIEQSKTSDAGQYTCKGHIDARSVSSHSSSAVSLTVTDLPTSTLTVTPDSPVFTGETVNLKCEIKSDHSDWRYEWYKGNRDKPVSQTSDRYAVHGDSLSIVKAISTDAGQYWCKGQRDGRPQSSHFSSAVDLTVKDLPTSTLTVNPNSVFTGETVNLKCVIESHYSNWRYEWYKGRTKVSEYYTVNRDTFTIRGVKKSDSGQYTCKGQRDGRPNSSQSSSAVSLTVMDLPTSTLTVTPDSPVFTGETVNLKCEIKSDHSDWRYEWYKGNRDKPVSQTSDRYAVHGDSLSIVKAISTDAGQYWCKGQRDGRPQSSHFSSAVDLTVKDLPTSTLTVTPDRLVFTGETVTLTCVIESYSEWRYEWYKGTDSAMLHTSDRYTVNKNTLTIRGATESDQGQYWCRGQRDKRPQSSQSRPAVALSVKDLPTSTLTVTPDSPVFIGDTVNLTCVIKSNESDWKYEWYKGPNNSAMLQASEHYTLNRDTLTIRGVNESDQDQYWCKGQRDGRPSSSQESNQINLSVN